MTNERTDADERTWWAWERVDAILRTLVEAASVDEAERTRRYGTDGLALIAREVVERVGTVREIANV
jgi:hypothetical protein